ncbi:MAG: 50S ribosomal protein L4 [Patescibacteria group bacterium]
MTKIAVYNLKGDKVKDLDLNKEVFDVEIKKSLIHQVFEALRANARQPWAYTKDRGEVSGGGKKPWKQKGTGRARHGSNRSPIWVGGGITFGPTNLRNYKQKINKKMNRKAFAMCLDNKIKADKLFIFEQFGAEPKTKEMEDVFKKINISLKKSLFVANENDAKTVLAVRNLKDLNIIRAQDLNVLNLLSNKNLIMSLDSFKILENRLAKK